MLQETQASKTKEMMEPEVLDSTLQGSFLGSQEIFKSLKIGYHINILNMKRLEREKNIAKNHLFEQKICKLRLHGPVT